MMLVSRIERHLKIKRKKYLKKNKEKINKKYWELWYLPWTIVREMDK